MKKGLTLIEWLTVICIVTMVAVPIGLIVTKGGLVKPQETEQFLRNQGYTHINITGWKPLNTSKNDFYSTGFQAKNPQGHWVNGTVTEGLFFKGKTIRFN
jgi:hypothetical protein